MASSGSYNFTVNRDEVINLAHQHIGAIGEGESANASQVTEASKLLNMILKLRAADGMPLWAIKRGTILPFTDSSTINTNSHVVTTYDSTTISSDEAAGQTALSITAAGTITNGDEIGIALDDGSVHWTTVTSGGGTTTVTVASALPSVASAGARVYAYTAANDRIQRPLRILEAQLVTVSDGSSSDIDQIPRRDYFSLANRTFEGQPSQFYYDPSLGSNIASPDNTSTWYGTFYLYPRFVDGTQVIEFNYHRPFQDVDSATDNLDFPQEFYLPIMMELAAMLGPKFGVPADERARLFQEAKAYREEALSTTYAEGSLYFQPADGIQETTLADTSYTDGVTTITADTMNDLNRLHYTILGDPADAHAVRAITGLMAQNSQSAAYTTVAGDANKHILHPSTDNNPRTFTIDSNANVPYAIGTMLTFVNEVNTVTIAITSDTMIMAGSGATGSRTLAPNGIATALKIGTTKWLINGTNLS